MSVLITFLTVAAGAGIIFLYRRLVGEQRSKEAIAGILVAAVVSAALVGLGYLGLSLFALLLFALFSIIGSLLGMDPNYKR